MVEPGYSAASGGALVFVPGVACENMKLAHRAEQARQGDAEAAEGGAESRAFSERMAVPSARLSL
jgi:hypothetical protein